MRVVTAVAFLLSVRSNSQLKPNLPSSSSSLSLVECWDDCFEPHALTTVEQAGIQRQHSFTSIFDRRVGPTSPLECAIESLLEQIDNNAKSNDNVNFVEYWWRDAKKPKSLEAHRDIDEEWARKFQFPVALGSSDKIGEQHCPAFGHVLYVSVEHVLAPTLIFEEEEGNGSAGGPPRPLKTLWSVPASSNRLLRFRGDCLHAVACPPLEWLQAPTDSKASVPASETEQRRAVLLFNTWKTAPLYPPVGQNDKLLLDARDERDKGKCRPKSLWKKAAIHAAPLERQEQEEMTILNVPLLGGFSRRACKKTELSVQVSVEQAVNALTSTSEIHAVTLHSL